MIARGGFGLSLNNEPITSLNGSYRTLLSIIRLNDQYETEVTIPQMTMPQKERQKKTAPIQIQIKNEPKGGFTTRRVTGSRLTDPATA